MWSDLTGPHKLAVVVVVTSDLFSFIFPQSITNTTSSMVTEVSAMFVDRTIFRTPSFGFLEGRIKFNSIIKTIEKIMTTVVLTIMMAMVIITLLSEAFQVLH